MDTVVDAGVDLQGLAGDQHAGFASRVLERPPRADHALVVLARAALALRLVSVERQ